MKIGVAGSGAVGSLFGGSLSRVGYNVTFLARGDHLNSMEKSGLMIQGTKESYKVSGNFTEKVSDLSDVDIVLFCFKSNDTKKMATELKQVLKPDAFIVTLQNGVDNEEVLSRIFGEERIISAATYVQVLITSPGHVKQEGRIKLVMGSLHKNAYDMSVKIVEMFQMAEVDVDHVHNIMEHKWKKLLWNVTFNPLSALMEVRVREILEDSNLHGIAMSVCVESINVAKKLGIPLDVDKTVSTIFNNATYAKEHQTSMLQDRIRNKKMEVESMCGYIVKKSKENSVPTHTLETIFNMLTYVNTKMI